jgi:hypothetical protein
METNTLQVTTQVVTQVVTGLQRNTIDKYYTKPSIVDLCINYIKEHIQISYQNDLVIEPSAGNGAFIEGIKTLSENHIFYDLEPDGVGILKQDYLLLDHIACEKYSQIHVIGNPPFGRQSSMAIKFIKKSCEFCDSLSFILPKSFKKDSLKKSVPLNYHLLFEQDLPQKSFLVNGVEHDVPCIIQIWMKKEHNREVNEKIEPIGFIFVKKTDTIGIDISLKPDISFRRVGVYAGKIDTKIDDKSEQSHYFIKFTNGKSIAENVDKLKNIHFDFNNTVGPKSISKQELIKAFSI